MMTKVLLVMFTSTSIVAAMTSEGWVAIITSIGAIILAVFNQYNIAQQNRRILDDSVSKDLKLLEIRNTAADIKKDVNSTSVVLAEEKRATASELATIKASHAAEIAALNAEAFAAARELATLRERVASGAVRPIIVEAKGSESLKEPVPLMTEKLKAIDEETGAHVGEVAIEPPDKIKIKPTGEHVGEVKVSITPEDPKKV